ncbi:hypothetical protein [Silvimonas iriomotensis]|uniref:Uncharacterized protein n=1 Tax=Silvimonas iriomotensis TaxID=449662 RepID=A0ABQ2P620_9NEIS|nr:hypothetical protein [Silvimonas iriomotensis]GGP18907.1 hypothetical protein GCM10010970_07980 [Silvimonas iriomotensis]
MLATTRLGHFCVYIASLACSLSSVAAWAANQTDDSGIVFMDTLGRYQPAKWTNSKPGGRHGEFGPAPSGANASLVFHAADNGANFYSKQVLPPGHYKLYYRYLAKDCPGHNVCSGGLTVVSREFGKIGALKWPYDFPASSGYTTTHFKHGIAGTGHWQRVRANFMVYEPFRIAIEYAPAGQHEAGSAYFRQLVVQSVP